MTNASSILPYDLHHSETRFCAIFCSKFLSVLFHTLFPTLPTDDSEWRNEKKYVLQQMTRVSWIYIHTWRQNRARWGWKGKGLLKPCGYWGGPPSWCNSAVKRNYPLQNQSVWRLEREDYKTSPREIINRYPIFYFKGITRLEKLDVKLFSLSCRELWTFPLHQI